MNGVERWILRKICKKVVRQGGHDRKIVLFLGTLVAEFRDEFTEDSYVAQDEFLKEKLESALDLVR